MCTPKGCTLYNACARVRVYVKPRRGNLGHFTRDLGQNYRVTFCSVPLRDYFLLRAPAGPLIPEGIWAPYRVPFFKTKVKYLLKILEFDNFHFIIFRLFTKKYTDTIFLNKFNLSPF